jgi:NAD(P)-dependent dehydrogenase (short-subunit alcohol dehydrogenase family)
LAVADIDATRLQGTGEELEGMGAEVHVHVVDVADAEKVESFCEAVYSDMGRVDVLCNNAGIGMGGRFEDITLEDWEWIVGVNLWGVIHGCHYFYPRMIAQGGGGHIVNTSSAAGLVYTTGAVPYVSTKYGVVGISETMRAEAALHGIGVSVLCPGFVATNITKTIRVVSGTERSTPEELRDIIDRLFIRRNYTPDRVAEAVVKGVCKNKSVIIAGPEVYAIDFAHRLSRRLFYLGIMAGVRLQKRFY